MMIRSLYYIGQVLRCQWKSKSELREIQNKRLRSLVQYVYNNNRFYHDFYKKNNVNINSIRNVEDLIRLPIISKEAVQKNFSSILNELRNKIKKEYVTRKTSGSTGKPLKVYFNPREWDYSEAVYLRSLLSTGYLPTEKLIVSYPYDSIQKKWFTKLGLMRKEIVSTDKPISTLIETIDRNRNTSVYGFPSMFRLLINEIYNSSINLKIKRFISTGELLSKKLEKEISEHFTCPIYNHYGTMEFNRIAWECQKKEGLHMDIDSLVVEFIKNNQQVNENEQGIIVLTNLHNYSFPLIRYEQGDTGSFSRDLCSCGRGLPLMKTIVGRNNDFIKIDENKYFSPVHVDVLLSKIEGIHQFRLIQKSLGDFDIYIIKKEDYDKDIIKDSIEKELTELFGSIKIKFYFVNKIEREKGGKLRSIISYCKK